MREIDTDRAPQYDIPLSQAVTHDGTLYASGQVGVDPGTGAVVSDDVREQTVQTMENLAAVLDAAGTSLDEVLKATVYLVDIDDYETVNEVYSGYVSDPAPARTAVEVGDLADPFETPLLVEIDAIAAL